MIEISQVLEYIDALDLPGMMIFIIIGGFKKWWVFGWMYDDIRKDRNEWKKAAVDGTTLATQAIGK